MSGMEKKIVIVTGANSGIGKATAIELAKKDFFVILACRSKEKAQEVLDIIKENGGEGEIRILDLLDLDSVRNFVNSYIKDYDRLDVLINNAGILRTHKVMTKDGFESQFQTNYLSHFLLTLLLLPTMVKTKGSRCAILSSLAHAWFPMNLEDINYDKEFTPRMSYGRSKLANLIFAIELTKRLKPLKTDFTINAVDPGIVGTNICYNRETGGGKFLATISKPFLRSPKMGAKGSIYLASTKNEVGSGNLYKNHHIKKHKDYADDPKINKALFDLSCQLVNIKFEDIIEKIEA